MRNFSRQPFPDNPQRRGACRVLYRADKLQRVVEMFENNLGRELTPEERKYPGLSVTVEPMQVS